MNDRSYGDAGVAMQMAAKRDAASGEWAYDAMAVAAEQLGRSLTGGAAARTASVEQRYLGDSK